jgi:hypothetical protein
MSRELVKDIIIKACAEFDSDSEFACQLRTVAIDYGRIAHSHKLLEEKCSMLSRKVAEKDERVRKLILQGATPEERKRMLQRDVPAEYREGAWKRRGGHGD